MGVRTRDTKEGKRRRREEKAANDGAKHGDGARAAEEGKRGKIGSEGPGSNRRKARTTKT